MNTEVKLIEEMSMYAHPSLNTIYYDGWYIVVSEQHRRKGYGQDICASLISNATKYGAKKAYLQVVDANTNAIELYKKLGFKDKYQYWFRVKSY